MHFESVLRSADAADARVGTVKMAVLRCIETFQRIHDVCKIAANSSITC